LTVVRGVFSKDIPNVFSGIVEIDETYIGGQWKNKRKSQREIKTKLCKDVLKHKFWYFVQRC